MPHRNIPNHKICASFNVHTISLIIFLVKSNNHGSECMRLHILEDFGIRFANTDSKSYKKFLHVRKYDMRIVLFIFILI